MSLARFFRSITAETDFAEEAMARCLDEFCKLGNWDIGHYFLAQESSGRELIPMSHWYSALDANEARSFKAATNKMRVVWGAGLTGRVMASCQPEWFEAAAQFTDWPRHAHIRAMELSTAFGFPVLLGGEVVAVFEVFSREARKPDSEQIEIGRFIGQHIARRLECDAGERELIRARQEAKDASIAKSNFLAQVSHEVRTPLNAILGMTHLLSGTRLDAEQKDYADSILTSAQSLLRIVNDLLDISRIEAGKFEIQSSDFEIGALLKETLSMLAHVARGKNLMLSSHVDPGLSPVLRGDPGRLRQILLNLIGNAIKFTDRGHVAIRVLGEEFGPRSARVRFEVEDTGIGIPVNLHSRVFEVFSQADNSACRKHGGTGLGLSISKRLVELMDGEIGFHSTEGKGSIFWFSVPLESAVQSVEAPEPQSAGGSALNPSRRTSRGEALVVEDNEINQRVMVRMLEATGLRVQAASSGPEALDKICKKKFDLVFMDCQMPGMDGYEVSQAIRRFEKQSMRPPVPIIAVTASAIKGDRERCLAAGMNDYLAKPVLPEQLAARIRYWLKTAERQHSEEQVGQLDLGALDRIRGMNVKGEADFLVELVTLFRDTSPARITRMRDAIEMGDPVTLSREAHYLKSSSANLGALHLSSLCQKLDEMGRRKSFDGAGETLEDLEFAYRAACSALQKELSTQDAR